MNPLAKLPENLRLVLYVVATLALLGVAAWQASGGNILTFISLLATSVVTGTAASNVKSKGV